MTVQKSNGLWFAYCDYCNNEYELNTDPDDSFEMAIREIKAEGWQLHYHAPVGLKGNEWTHKCSDCVQDAAEKAMREAGIQ